MNRPEQAIHRAVVNHLAWRALPDVFFFHPANGGRRSKIEAAIFKGLGVKAGVPDLIIIHRSLIFGLEIKSACGRLGTSQRNCLDAMADAGAHVAVVHGLDEALTTLEFWGVIRKERFKRVPELKLVKGGQ